MHPNSQNKDYNTYSYLPSSSSKSSRNIHQYYNSRLYTQQFLYSTRFQHRHQLSTAISNLPQLVSVFADSKLPRHRPSNVIPFPSTYISPNVSRRTPASDTPLASASTMRARLLIDIQHNINEIDYELSSLERQSTIARYSPPRLSSIVAKRQTLTHQKAYSPPAENQLWLNKPKRVYQVIPHITTNESKKTPFIGQYHYAPETEEIEILENDPENDNLESIVCKIPELSVPERFSLDQFRREQSALPQNRALIFVPEYGDNNNENESAEPFHENNPIDINMARSLTVSSLHTLESPDKLNIEDFELLIQTAPESKVKSPSVGAHNPDKVSDKIEADLVVTISSEPVKHADLSTQLIPNIQEEPSSSPQPTINDTDVDTAYFFSDFGNEGEGDESLISMNPNYYALRTESEVLAYDIISNSIVEESQGSFVIPRSAHTPQQQQQQLIVVNNNENVKGTESEKIIATKKYIITAVSALPTTSN